MDRSPRIPPEADKKDVNFPYTTAAFLVAYGNYPTCLPVGRSPESWALLCRANLPGDWALYAIGACPPLEDSSAHSFALRLLCLRQTSFRPSLTGTPLPSASTFVNMFNTLTGFTYRGLSPHKPFGLELRAERFTPMPGVHESLKTDVAKSRHAA